MAAPSSPSRGEQNPLFFGHREHEKGESPSNAAVGRASRRVFFSEELEDPEVAAATAKQPCPEESPVEKGGHYFSSTPTGAPFVSPADLVCEKSWDELISGDPDKGSGFVRYTDIKIGENVLGEDVLRRVWVKRPRHIGRTVLASMISYQIGDESVVPATLARLRDGTIVTLQPHRDDLNSSLETNISKINLEDYEYAIFSFINAITLSFFDDDIYNREGLDFVTVDLEASFPLSTTLTIREKNKYGEGFIEKPKLSSALPFLFLLKGKLYEPISPEIKEVILKRINNPKFFTEEKLLKKYMKANGKLSITESRYETIVEDGSRVVKEEDLTGEAIAMITGYLERLNAVKSTLVREGSTPFDLLYSVNPLFADILKIGSFLYKGKSILDEIATLIDDIDYNISEFERRLSTKPDSPEKDVAVRALEDLKIKYAPGHPETEDLTIFSCAPTLSHREIWGDR